MIHSSPWKRVLFYAESDNIKSFRTHLTIFEGTTEGAVKGTTVGTIDGTIDGTVDGTPVGTIVGTIVGVNEKRLENLI